MRRAPRMFAGLAVLVACGAPEVAPVPGASEGPGEPTAPGGSLTLTGARLPGGAPVEIVIRDGRLAEVGARVARTERTRDLGGRVVVPGVIDSHVHLSYWPAAAELAQAGVVAAVDLGAPRSSLDDGRGRRRPLRVAGSGPMITATGGYPTRGWGRDGYGREVADAAAARRAVRELVSDGAALIKVALGDDGLDRPRLDAVIAAARSAGVPVVAHALDARSVALAADAGVDVLAHVPVEPIDEALARRWRGRHVITTLSAFAPAAAAANLERLVAAGALPVYGTDLGNTRELGVSRAEIAAMSAAGMSGAAILESMTTTPARLWGWDDLGAVAAGRRAALLVLDRDPLEDPLALAAPVEVTAID